MTLPNIQICNRCVYDETVPLITFDEDGICNYCHMHDDLDRRYPSGEEGENYLVQLAAEMKESSKGKKYDCVVGVSGGCDSSYLIVKLIELGLKPLAVHFDNTWNSEIATQNIYKVLNKLNVDLYTYVVDSQEYDDILRAFMLSGTKNLDAALDIGLASVLYRTAEKHGLKYIVEGHSFRTEGIAPLDWSYMDGKYIASVHKQYGSQKMKTYPNMSISQFIRYTAIRGITRVRPLYYMEYPKEQVKEMLAKEFGWEWYGGHHLENRFTSFFVNYVLPKRWDNDLRYLGHAALVRSDQLSRDEALKELEEPVECAQELVELIQKRLKFDDKTLNHVMTQPLKTWRNFPNYKKSFERLRPLFALLVKIGRVPESFYMKFCFPNQLGEDGEKKKV